MAVQGLFRGSICVFDVPVACGGGDEQMDRRHFLFNALLAA